MFEIGSFLVLLTVGYLFGSAREKRHIEEIRRREAMLLHLAVRMDGDHLKLASGEAFLVSSSVVVASDYFKDFTAGLRNFLGGRVSAYESLLDRARREAVLRIKEQAAARDARELVCVRLETSMIQGMGVEVLAYGTAVR